MEHLMVFLFKEDPARARQLIGEFESAGLETPMKFGERGAAIKDGHRAKDGEREKRRLALLLEFAVASLERAVSLFDEVLAKIVVRLKRAETLKLAAAIITTILSSGVVASLVRDPNSQLTLFVGLLAVLSSIATVVAGRLEGGDANLAQAFAEITGKHETARSLLELLKTYAKDPVLFDDTETKLRDVELLVIYLNSWRQRLGIIT